MKRDNLQSVRSQASYFIRVAAKCHLQLLMTGLNQMLSATPFVQSCMQITASGIQNKRMPPIMAGWLSLQW